MSDDDSKAIQDLNRQRRAGVLLHPTSLPGSLASGDIGHEAYRFIEFLHAHGFRVWQMLPLGPTHEDLSPYQCLSSHAGNPQLISLDWLKDRGWLQESARQKTQSDSEFRQECLYLAASAFYGMQDRTWQTEFQNFRQQQAHWLDDYCLYMALKKKYHNTPWYDWPEEARHRDASILQQATEELQQDIRQVQFEQFVFFHQWKEIRNYARQYGVELFGDVPIFVAHDSADVWSQRKNFIMDDDGNMPVVAGVPPDAFSDTGQRWGNPLYDWEYMQQDGYQWWQQRFSSQLQLFDMVRIDHFRGLQACWEIPGDEQTAINGCWVEVPGREMLTGLYQRFRQLPLVAEDLGVITDEVIALKEAFGLPGMKVLQFAFDGNTANPHLPHNHLPHDIVYTGTHDNDTTPGWLRDQDNYNKRFLEDYIGHAVQAEDDGLWDMIRMALCSVSFMSMLPMQDLLMLDSKARMNRPGTTEGNWQWRFQWRDIDQDVMTKIKQMISLYQR